MINILVPLSGKHSFKVDGKNSFPKFLSEVDGKLLIERAAEPFTSLSMKKKIIVAVPQKETEKYKLHNVIQLLGDDITTCLINGNTQGAVCSALLAIESLDLNSPLIISNFEQVIELDLEPYIKNFIEQSVDAGVFTFQSIHPKWSYVKVDDKGHVRESAEKIPISKDAITGLYYFKTASLFIESAKSVIRKDVKTNDSFFISSTLNEIILNEGIVKAERIDNGSYYHINDDYSLESFEVKLTEDRNKLKREILQLTEEYIDAFNRRDIEAISYLLSDDFELIEPKITTRGKSDTLSYISNVLQNALDLSFVSKNILITDELQSVIEFELKIDGTAYVGSDVIQWKKSNLMRSMNAYLYEVKNG